MSLPRVRGHRELRQRLAHAVAAGTISQSILLQGPRGAGKERIGLWLGQLLLCESPSAEGPCHDCRPCRLAERLEHPDLHWFFPLPRPDGATPEKLRDKLEDARAAELAARRDDPGYVPRFDRVPAIYLAAVQRLQQLASVKPAMGRRKIFVVGDAELMVPQESSQEAANAFLKLLEEPPDDTTIVITSSQPGALLPTILSRVLSIRVTQPGEEAVRDYLQGELEMADDAVERLARLSRGSIGAALQLAGEEGEGGRARTAARALLIAALSTGGVARLAAASRVRPFGGRGEFTEDLEALADWLRDLMAVASGVPDEVADPTARQLLQRAVDRKGVHPLGVAAALERVAEAQFLAQGNVNPQLILADLLRALESLLVAPPEALPLS